jgi:hypothetical protein
MGLSMEVLKVVKAVTVEVLDQRGSSRTTAGSAELEPPARLELVRDDMKNVEGESVTYRSLPGGRTSDLYQTLEEVAKRLPRTPAGLPDEARKVVIDTWFIKTIIWVSDIFYQRVTDGPPLQKLEKKLFVDIFEEGVDRGVPGIFSEWCDELHRLACCFSNMDLATDTEDAKEFIVPLAVKAFRQYGWIHFTRQEETFQETATNVSARTDGGRSIDSIVTCDLCKSTMAEELFSTKLEVAGLLSSIRTASAFTASQSDLSRRPE